jgi:GNAT superfamily N-acetyltransferase
VAEAWSGVEIRKEALDGASARALIAALNGELSGIYPEAGANHFRLDPDEVAPGNGAFFVAYLGGDAVGCGALRRIDAGTAEIKRMFVRPEARGRGISVAILETLETEARRLGLRRILLETGVRQTEALALYRRGGYDSIPPYGEYLGSPLSVCMGKDLPP